MIISPLPSPEYHSQPIRRVSIKAHAPIFTIDATLKTIKKPLLYSLKRNIPQHVSNGFYTMAWRYIYF